ncbi:MAG: glycoside hydrolase family 3 N-terminal domain-containing protein [Inhella sp.]
MSNAPYRDPGLPLQARVDDLLARMTLPEKVGQLMQLDGQRIYRELIRDFHVGSLLHINGSDADAAQAAAAQTRLGIPLMLADDGIHGHSFWAGATIFPTQLALACSWNPGLAREVARVTAVEMRATGLKWTFSPVLCLARDLRWGRINETFGEDPLLLGTLALAMIEGYQGQGLHDPDAVLATAKHYAGYSETLGGRDASEAELSRRKLRSTFLPPFERAARGGAMAFMTGYQAIDGVPSTANRWLLTEVLREEWGFEGILVTDWNNLGHLVDSQRVCADHAEAAALAIRAGNDLIMATPEFFEGAQAAVARGLLSREPRSTPWCGACWR